MAAWALARRLFGRYRCAVMVPLLALAVIAGVLSVPQRAAAAPVRPASTAGDPVTQDAGQVRRDAVAASAKALDAQALAPGAHTGALASTLTGADAKAEAAAQAPAPPVPPTVQPAPDPVEAALSAAQVKAKSSQSAVEVSERTGPRSRTVANPDGTFTTSVSTQPVRYQDGSGAWRSLNLALQPSGARLNPAAAGPWAARLATDSAASDGLVQAGPDGSVLSWSPAGIGSVTAAVPAGSAAAAYPAALPGGWEVDEQVTAGGAEESVVIPTRLSSTALGGAASYRDVFTLPAGVSARQAAPGADGVSLGVEFVDSTGHVIATFGGGRASDSSGLTTDSSGLTSGTPSLAGTEPASVAVTTRLVGQSAGQATVDSGVPAAWLADPARVFPVTIDPHMTAGTSFSGDTTGGFDAYVDQAFPTTAEGVYDPTNLKIGVRSVNGTLANSYSFIWFNLGDFDNSENHVFSATLSLNNTYSYTCTAEGVDLAAVGGPWNASTITWNNHPGGTGPVVSKTFSHGYSSACPAARESFDVTQIAQLWANGPSGYNGGLADSGIDFVAHTGNVTDYKRFGAAENGAANASQLSISWENCTYYGTNTNKVCTAIRDEYTAKGGPAQLGLPTSGIQTLTNNGSGQVFGGWSIFQAPSASVAHEVHDPIRAKYAALGWEGGYGYPQSDTQTLAGGTGQVFDNGSIFDSAATGAHEVHGDIRNEYQATGWESGPLGFPSSDVQTLTGGQGANFLKTGAANPNGGIYEKTGATAAHYVNGAIYNRYAALGWNNSFLGYPTGDPFTLANGDTRQNGCASLKWPHLGPE